MKFESLAGGKKRAALLSSVTGLAILLSSCSAGEQVSGEQAAHQVQDEYQQAFNAASPAGKFAIQYLVQAKEDVREYPNAVPGSEVQVDDYAEAQYLGYTVTINNGCLGDTAYDIDGGRMNIEGQFGISGLFVAGSGSVSGSGDTPAAAAYATINPDNPNQLLVESGHSNAPKLTFDGVSGSELIPADDATKRILETYGCVTGPDSMHVVESYAPGGGEPKWTKQIALN